MKPNVKIIVFISFVAFAASGFVMKKTSEGEKVTDFSTELDFQKAGHYDLETDLFTEETWKQESNLRVDVQSDGSGMIVLSIDGQNKSYSFSDCTKFPQYYVFSLESGLKAKLVTLTNGDVWGFTLPESESTAIVYFKDK